MKIKLSDMKLHVRAEEFTQIPMNFEKPFRMRKMARKQVVLTHDDMEYLAKRANISVEHFADYDKRYEDNANADEKKEVMPVIASALSTIFSMSEDELKEVQKANGTNPIHINFNYDETHHGTQIAVELEVEFSLPITQSV